MLKKVLVALVLAVAVLAVVVATRPDTYHVARSIVVSAPPEAVFATVGDFRTFPRWSPWQRRDPAMRTTVSDPPSGLGASYAWEGNKEVGKGRMTITESTSPSRLRQRLEFIEPFASVAETGFDIQPAGSGAAKVTWSMEGKNDFMGKAFGLVMNMDEMIGKDFEEGLAKLKQLVESRPPAAAAGGGAAAAAVPPASAVPARP